MGDRTTVEIEVLASGAAPAAGPHAATEPAAAKRRRLTVYTRHRGGVSVPEIRMGGNWLERSGFLPGCRLEVAVLPGQLVVTITAPPGPKRKIEVHDDSVPYCLTPHGARALRRVHRNLYRHRSHGPG